jgi:hypothetical protein
MTDPVQLFRGTYVELFNRGVALLEARAASGGDREKAALDDVKNARGASWLRFEGAGEVWLTLESGVLAAVDARPASLPTRLVVAMDADVAKAGIEELTGVADLDSDEAALRAARSASKAVEDALGGKPLDFHLILRDTPDFDEVIVRIALGADDLPERPTFTATVRWDDVEAVRGSGQSLQQLMMGGKLKLAGDYSRAMQVAMQLMQQRRR